MINTIIAKKDKHNLCKQILQQLPEWFELPASIEDYADFCENCPFWISEKEGKVQGFISLKETSKYTVEIYVMGVCKEFHRQGVGRALVDAASSYAKKHGYEYMQVKTVQDGKYPEYDKTNVFYQSMGFRELECLPLWDEENPCQVYVMKIS